jgi:cytochrome c5
MVAKSRERQLISIVSVVIGGLVGLVLGLVLLATRVGEPSEAERLADTEYRREVQERTAPFGRVAVAGQDNSALAIAGSAPASAAAPVAPVAPVAAAVLGGAQAYAGVCAACHAAGIAGAPKFGDRAAWAPRLAQGSATLRTHALAGYQGKAGVMPAKGGRPDLADQSVANAVDYMVAAAK